MNKEIEKVFSEMESKYGIDMKGKTPIGDLPNIMGEDDWYLVSCFLKYPNGVPKDKGAIMNRYEAEGSTECGRTLITTWYHTEVVAEDEDHAETLARDIFDSQGACRQGKFYEELFVRIDCIEEDVESEEVKS